MIIQIRNPYTCTIINLKKKNYLLSIAVIKTSSKRSQRLFSVMNLNANSLHQSIQKTVSLFQMF